MFELTDAIPLETLKEKGRKVTVFLFLKRTVDIILSMCMIVIALPLCFIIALWIKIDSKGNILFARTVFGLHGKEFVFYKFRTMVNNAHEMLKNNKQLTDSYNAGGKVDQDLRITRLGAFLRKYSLDELPQLYNVLKGDMTLVGPRVLGDIELSWYGRYQKKVLTVKPGLSGLAQVFGRSNLSIEKRIACDLYYIRHQNILLDIFILFRTAVVVVLGKGAK